MNARDDVLGTLWPAIFDFCGVTVDYYRDGVAVATDLDAVKGSSTTADLGDEYGHSLVADDWIFKLSDLRDAGIDSPAKYDRIVWTDPTGTVRTFELKIDDGNRQYDHVDQLLALFRVHTEEI